VLRNADAVFANLECAITAHALPWSRTPKVFRFRASPESTAIRRAADVRWVGLASNDSMDFEPAGLLDTLAHLDAAGIAPAGVGRDLAEAKAPSLVAAEHLRFGLLALTGNEAPFAAGEGRPGTWYTPIMTTGDVPDDHAVDPVLRNDHGMLFRLSVDADGPARLTMRPLSLSFARVDLAEGRTDGDREGRLGGVERAPPGRQAPHIPGRRAACRGQRRAWHHTRAVAHRRAQQGRAVEPFLGERGDVALRPGHLLAPGAAPAVMAVDGPLGASWA
jgi:hypothetical protein